MNIYLLFFFFSICGAQVYKRENITCTSYSVSYEYLCEFSILYPNTIECDEDNGKTHCVSDKIWILGIDRKCKETPEGVKECIVSFDAFDSILYISCVFSFIIMGCCCISFTFLCVYMTHCFFRVETFFPSPLEKGICNVKKKRISIKSKNRSLSPKKTFFTSHTMELIPTSKLFRDSTEQLSVLLQYTQIIDGLVAFSDKTFQRIQYLDSQKIAILQHHIQTIKQVISMETYVDMWTLTYVLGFIEIVTPQKLYALLKQIGGKELMESAKKIKEIWTIIRSFFVVTPSQPSVRIMVDQYKETCSSFYHVWLP